MNPDYNITTEAELRQVIGDEVPGLQDKVLTQLDDYAQTYIAKSPFLVLSTADAQGNIDASPKGDGPGFVHVADSTTLWVPDRPGNKLAYGHLNILSNPRVGLLFMIPGTPETLRVNGRATLNSDPQVLRHLSARDKPATVALRVEVDEIFFHCAKAYIRSRLWQPDSWPQRHRVSFGEMFAAQRNQSDEVAKAVDDMVEADYRDNL